MKGAEETKTLAVIVVFAFKTQPAMVRNFYNAVNELADCQSKLPEHALDADGDTTR